MRDLGIDTDRPPVQFLTRPAPLGAVLAAAIGGCSCGIVQLEFHIPMGQQRLMHLELDVQGSHGVQIDARLHDDLKHIINSSAGAGSDGRPGDLATSQDSEATAVVTADCDTMQ